MLNIVTSVLVNMRLAKWFRPNRDGLNITDISVFVLAGIQIYNNDNYMIQYSEC